MKNLSIIALFFIAALASCKKDKFENTTPNTVEKVSAFNEIKTNQTFDWSTTKKVNLTVTGLKTEVVINRNLVVSSTDNKTTFLTLNHQMDQNLNTNLILPIDVKEVNVTFGAITKKFSTQTSVISFDFLPEITE